MKILLINPPNLNYARISTGWDFEIGNIGLLPPYGLISLAAYIRKCRDDEIHVLDCIAENYDLERLGHYFKEFQPSVVGIGAFTYTFYDVLQTARLAKNVLPDVHVCVGGSHTMLFPEETISHPEIDSLILGEGEKPFLNLLNCMDEDKPINTLSSVICKNTEFSPETKLEIYHVNNLDLLPFPAYGLINGEHYRGTFGRRKKMLCICSSRGCPYGCTFCQVLIKKYRTHSVEYIMEMMKQFYNQGYREFYFFDDLFNITTRRVIEISEAILSNELRINWLFRGRADRLNEETIKIASKAGCSHILLGVEDYTNDGLKRIKKGITIEQAKKVIEWAHKYGIEVSTNWIIGLPNHKSPEDIKNLVNVSIDLRSDYAQYTILQLLPGCEMFEEAVNEGIIHRESWSKFVKNPVSGYQIEPYDKYMSINELSELYKYCHECFYKRYSYILKLMVRIKSFYDIKRAIKPALKILFK